MSSGSPIAGNSEFISTTGLSAGPSTRGARTGSPPLLSIGKMAPVAPMSLMTPLVPVLLMRLLRAGTGLVRDRVREWLARRSLFQLAATGVALLWLLTLACRQFGDALCARTAGAIASEATVLLMLLW